MQVNPTMVTIIVGICSIAAFFIGQAAGVKKTGYEQGVRDAKMDTLTKKVDELVAEVKEWNMGVLEQRVAALEKEISKNKGSGTSGS
ncbi:MAG: hypothetical protein AB9856_14510 [Cellulosilyticaceae bacterium]